MYLHENGRDDDDDNDDDDNNNNNNIRVLCIGRAGRDVGVYGVCVRERERERDIIEESFTNYRSRRCWINFKASADLKAFVCEIYNRRKKRWVLLYSL
jgi:hypothetical protein